MSAPVGPTVPQISIAIMAHHSRLDSAKLLSNELHAYPVVDYTDDRNQERERRIGDLAWREGAGGDWTIVLQDDALPIDGFRQHAAAALAHAPQTAVSFYVGTGRPYAGLVDWAVKRAEAFEASWLQADDLYWGVAVAMPTPIVEEFLAWAKGSTLAYDRRIGAFWRETRRAYIRYTWPSLVDHDEGHQQLTHREEPGVRRRAHRVGVPVGWDGPVTSIGALPRRR